MSKYFLWKGIDPNGKIITGKIAAMDKETAINIINHKNIYLLKIRPSCHWAIFTKNKISKKNISSFCCQLAMLINANIAITTALEIIEHTTASFALTKLVQALQQDIKRGNSLSSTFATYPHYFNQLFCGLIYAGEQAGTLDLILQYLVTYIEKTEKQKRKIFKALFYPICVLIVTLIVTIILLIFVIPEFKTIYAGFGATLPLYTQYIIKVADIIQTYGIWLLSGIVGIILLNYYALKYSVYWQHQRDCIILKIPIIGTLLYRGFSYRIFKTLAITFKAGLPLITALNITIKITNNWLLKNNLQKIIETIAHGQSLYTAITKYNLFPYQITQLIAIGEETGNLDAMLEKIAAIYEEEINHITDNLNNLLEPLIMVILGILIGSLIIGMYLPIFNLGKII